MNNRATFLVEKWLAVLIQQKPSLSVAIYFLNNMLEAAATR